MASEHRRQVATYLTDNDYTELLSEAEKLDVNVSTMLRLIVRDWLTLQDRSAVASRRAGEGEDR
jgi:predicted DNA-binding ribbon-helix-helix protein